MHNKFCLIARKAPASAISARLLLIALDSASTAILTGDVISPYIENVPVINLPALDK